MSARSGRTVGSLTAADLGKTVRVGKTAGRVADVRHKSLIDGGATTTLYFYDGECPPNDLLIVPATRRCEVEGN